MFQTSYEPVDPGLPSTLQLCPVYSLHNTSAERNSRSSFLVKHFVCISGKLIIQNFVITVRLWISLHYSPFKYNDKDSRIGLCV